MEARIASQKEECRRRAGEERFEHIEVVLQEILNRERPPPPEELDPSDVYLALMIGKMTRDGHELFDPNWTRDRDDAYRSVELAIDKLELAIEKLRGILEQRGLGKAVDGLKSESERAVDGLKSELERLRNTEYRSAPGPESARLDWSANTRAKLLAEDRKSLGWNPPTGGRPRAAWRRDTIRYLCDAGLNRKDAQELVEAAGLSEPSPKN